MKGCWQTYCYDRETERSLMVDKTLLRKHIQRKFTEIHVVRVEVKCHGIVRVVKQIDEV